MKAERNIHSSFVSPCYYSSASITFGFGFCFCFVLESVGFLGAVLFLPFFGVLALI